jgi:hypothetical protein
LAGSGESGVSGITEVRAALQAIGTGLPMQFLLAMFEEMKLIAKVSQERTPVLTGSLRESHIVQLDKDAMIVTISVGGPDAPYALYVHENLDAFHEVGQAKFLESAVLEALPGLGDRIAERVDL